jgi:4-hydroxybenzoate polyprenyltransferase
VIPTTQGTGTADRPLGTRLPRLLSYIRLDEVLLLQGAPLLGALFSMGTITRAKGLDLLVLLAASSSLVAHVFVLNDCTGASADLRDPNRAARAFTARGITRGAAGALCVSLLAVSLLLLIPFGSTAVSLAIALAILSALYSAPWFAMKGVPLASSVLHLAGGLLHFLLGYSLFHPLDARSLEIGSFFALTFSAGHLTHEARDCGSDLLNGIQTNAVKFGRTRSFAAGFLLFTAADVLLFMLAIRGVVPNILVVVAGVYPLHLWWTLRTLAAGLTFENIRRLQVRYRVLYAIIGVIMMLAVSSESGRLHDIL